MQNVKWIKKEVSLDKAQDLSKSLGISLFTAQLLINRGIDTHDSAEKFLRIPSKLVMESWDKKTSEAIGKRLLEAIEKQELITVHGDYDVDGVTGAAVLSLFLKSKGANFNYYLPDRFGDGYGLSSNTIKRLAENNKKILITADCGISNHNEIDLAKELGIEVIVTDHHTIPETLP
ncbi:MAG: DHH family phosphoesterase, partial [Candidatus Sericytochromatia bacterium]